MSADTMSKHEYTDNEVLRDRLTVLERKVTMLHESMDEMQRAFVLINTGMVALLSVLDKAESDEEEKTDE